MSLRLSMFIWHNRETREPEKVYEFPWSEATAEEISYYGRRMYSREPMKRPILSIPDSDLTEAREQRHTVDLSIVQQQSDEMTL